MEEPENIVQILFDFFSKKAIQDLKGKNVLVTAGPTHEAIDPVRFIGNHSSGKMGIALAKECRNRGAQVTLVLGPVTISTELGGVHLIRVISAEDMYQACQENFTKTDIAIMAAAVADYKPENAQTEKIKKSGVGVPEIKLTQTRDIIKSLGAIKRNDQIVVGFALETNNEKTNALEKLKSKKADFIVLNSLNDGAAFGSDTNKITIFSASGAEQAFESKSKELVAKDILDTILNTTKSI